MTKQEFLAMSLPYAVKILTHEEAVEIAAIGTMQYQIAEKDFAYGWYGDIYNCKPILRPLSDLTKEIEHKGEKFVPIEKLREIIGGGWCGVYERAVELMQVWGIGTLKDKIKYLPFELIWLLIPWYFDIADLISKGEAIDINTLEINPYK